MALAQGFEAMVVYNARQDGYMLVVKLGDAQHRVPISAVQWNSCGKEAGSIGQLSFLAALVADSCTRVAVASEAANTTNVEEDA